MILLLCGSSCHPAFLSRRSNQLFCIFSTKLGSSHVNSWLEQLLGWRDKPYNTMAEVMGFLNTMLRDCIISSEAKVKWLPYSPSLNTHDYFFCHYSPRLQAHVSGDFPHHYRCHFSCIYTAFILHVHERYELPVFSIVSWRDVL